MMNRNNNSSSWFLYVALVFCRVVVCPFLPGYVHPDEFFQGGQELWLGCPPFTPWEFQSQHAVRSIVPPTIMTWLPLRLYASIVRGTVDNSFYSLSGWEVLAVPRIFCAILSVVTVDMSIWFLLYCRSSSSSSPSSTTTSSGAPFAVLVVASAWPSLVLLNRPFTNSLETMILAVLLLVTNRRQPTHGFALNLFVVGVTCALGLFTRFTFVFVAIPTMLRYMVATKVHCSSISSALLGLSVMTIGFLVMCAIIVRADGLYYKTTTTDGGGWMSDVIVTPWNALLYNSKVDNLQHHGLHPRWTHVLINMLLLYGPLAIMFYANGIVSLRSFISKAANATMHGDESQETWQERKLQTTCVWTIISGLGFLSLAPHQEPRFLLPLLVPLAIVSRDVWQSRWIRTVWITFNAILLMVYGILHQGGIVPLLVADGESPVDNNVPSAILFYHTYMPPTFVSRRRGKKNTDSSCSVSVNDDVIGSCAPEQLGCGDLTIIDLQGSSAEALFSALEEHVDCEKGGTNVDGREGRVHLVSPPLEVGSVLIGASNCTLGAPYSCHEIQSYRPHLTTEDFPPFDGYILNTLSSMKLGVYEIACVNRSGSVN